MNRHSKTSLPSVALPETLETVLIGGSQMAGRIREFDWSNTELGPIFGWPQSLRTAVNIMLQSPAPIVILWGLDGTMLYNDSYAEFAGGRHPALLGAKVLEGWTEVMEFNRHVMDECLAGKSLSYKDRHFVLQRHGAPEDIWMDLDYSPVLGETGEPVGVFAITVDVSDQVHTRKRSEQIAREQQRLVTMTNQRNELIRLNTAKDEFISLASHQLRTPATAVKQYMSLLLGGYGGTLSADQQSFLQKAYDSNERQLDIISDLLKTAQIDSRRYVLTKDRHELAPIIQEVIDEITPSVELKQQTITFHNLAGADKVMVDPAEMKLVFANLLENASKYSYPAQTIAVTLRKSSRGLEVDVTDTGVGFSSADARRIFEKFTRVNNELSDTVTGSGLGLYWAKKIVKLHQGTIKTQSGLGRGSTFTVRLPL